MAGLALGEATGRTDKPRSGRRTTSPAATSIVLGSGNLGLIYLMEEKRRLTLEELERAPSPPHPGPARAPARRLDPRPLGGARARSRSAREGVHHLADGTIEGVDPLAAVLAHRAAPSPAHRRLRARRRHHGRELLRPAARRGMRVRGADLVPRRPGRHPDAAVHPLSGRPPAPDRPIIGAAAVHGLSGWRRHLQATRRSVGRGGDAAPAPREPEQHPQNERGDHREHAVEQDGGHGLRVPGAEATSAPERPSSTMPTPPGVIGTAVSSRTSPHAASASIQVT